jgi:hypothetical protein
MKVTILDNCDQITQIVNLIKAKMFSVITVEIKVILIRKSKRALA